VKQGPARAQRTSRGRLVRITSCSWRGVGSLYCRPTKQKPYPSSRMKSRTLSISWSSSAILDIAADAQKLQVVAALERLLRLLRLLGQVPRQRQRKVVRLAFCQRPLVGLRLDLVEQHVGPRGRQSRAVDAVLQVFDEAGVVEQGGGGGGGRSENIVLAPVRCTQPLPRPRLQEIKMAGAPRRRTAGCSAMGNAHGVPLKSAGRLARQRLALIFDLRVKEAQRSSEQPLQRITLAFIEEWCGVCIGRHSIAPVLVPDEQLNQCLRTLHYIACVVEECSLLLLRKIKSLALNPFERFEQRGRRLREVRATNIGACV
jgi:hypothetical protein